jgi:2-polyprenyl-3-methyl-5-hydroxy-6-metoxy-1,4-benzoquinol methylase
MQEKGFTYHDSAATWDDYVARPVIALCKSLGAKSVLDIGCGNGALAGALSREGIQAVGCDVTESGVRIAREAHPNVEFHVLGVYNDHGPLEGRTFDVILSVEVIEHLFDPAALPRFARGLLKPGGHFIVSTPYHGYLKNIAIALLDKWDRHHNSTEAGGHIKFFSNPVLKALLESNGFRVDRFMGAGRLPLLWKSTIAVARPV